MNSGKPKKTIADMSPDWMSQHAVHEVPPEWNKEVGVGETQVATPEELEQAWKQLNDLNLVGSMVADIVTAIAKIRACPETESLHRDTFRKIAPMIERAAKDFYDAGKFIDDAGIKLGNGE